MKKVAIEIPDMLDDGIKDAADMIKVNYNEMINAMLMSYLFQNGVDVDIVLKSGNSEMITSTMILAKIGMLAQKR